MDEIEEKIAPELKILTKEMSDAHIELSTEDWFHFLDGKMKEFAGVWWREGGQVPGYIYGFSKDPRPIGVEFERGKGNNPKYIKWVKDRLKSHKCYAACLAVEAWQVSGKRDGIEDVELSRFIKAGGSLQYWPGAKESFYVEIFEPPYFMSHAYEIIRVDGKVESLNLNPGSVDFCDVTKEKVIVDTPILKLF